MTRRVKNWIAGFVEYTANLSSEVYLRKWAAVSILAGAMERKVYAMSMGKPLYPNFFIFLVAPPGIGKTVLVTEVRNLWQEVDKLHVGASSLTKASFVDELADSERNVTMLNQTPAVQSFHALNIASGELGVLLPGYDSEFMTALTDLYDCQRYSEKRRTKDRVVEIPKPYLNLIACTTPSFLSDLLPEGAWDQGFMARVLMIYSGVQQPIQLFDLPETNQKLWNKLAADLKDINNLAGEITYTSEAKKTILEWYDGGFYRNSSKPDHPKLVNYTTRRHMHMLKLSQILCVNYSDDMLITEDHVLEAIAMLMEMEERVPDIFKAMNSGGDYAVIDATWYHTFSLYLKNERAPIREELIIQFLQHRTPAHSVERILDLMVKSGMLTRTHINKVGTAYHVKAYQRP